MVEAFVLVLLPSVLLVKVVLEEVVVAATRGSPAESIVVIFGGLKNRNKKFMVTVGWF